MKSKTVYLIVSIDTECDKSSDWSIRRPMSFRGVIDAIPGVLTPLFQPYGIKPTYLLSPEVVSNQECVNIFKDFSNCELGTHLHGELIEPCADFDTQRTDTPQLAYEPQIEFEKLRNLTISFERQFGYSPKSFRAGRFGISAFTLTFLDRLGYKVDSSVAPFWIHEFEQKVNNHWGAPLQPYFPSKSDPVRKGKSSVLQVPVTIVNKFYLSWPCWFLRQFNPQRNRYKRLLNKLRVSTQRTLWLRPQRSTGKEMIEIADALISHTPRTFVVLNMMYHNVEVVPGMSPYAATDDDVQLILDSQRILFDHLFRQYHVICAGLSEIYPLFETSS